MQRSSILQRKTRRLVSSVFWVMSGLTVGGLALAPALFPLPVGEVRASAPGQMVADVDVSPAVEVIHTPPIMALMGEAVEVSFTFSCAGTSEPLLDCDPQATLWTSTDAGATYSPTKLRAMDQNGLRSFAASLPSVSEAGQTVRYYLDINEPKYGISLRYPVSGDIAMHWVKGFTSITLPETASPASPKSIATFGWGTGVNQVGLAHSMEGAVVGPNALDVSPQGDLAILDPVNGRVLTLGVASRQVTSVGLPLASWGDIAYGDQGDLLYIDLVGASMETKGPAVPQLYKLSNKNAVFEKVGPVYGFKLAGFANGGRVLDLTSEPRLLNPMGVAGMALDRTTQRDGWGRPDVFARWVDDHRSRFFDPATGFAFELTSTQLLGSIASFTRTPSGYLVIFEQEQLRAVYVGHNGRIVRDVAISDDQYTALSPYQRLAVRANGDIYILQTTESDARIDFISK